MLPSCDVKPARAAGGKRKIYAGGISKRSLPKMRTAAGALVFSRERRDALLAVREERTEHGAAGLRGSLYAGCVVRRWSGGGRFFSVCGAGDRDGPGL